MDSFIQPTLDQMDIIWISPFERFIIIKCTSSLSTETQALGHLSTVRGAVCQGRHLSSHWAKTHERHWAKCLSWRERTVPSQVTAALHVPSMLKENEVNSGQRNSHKRLRIRKKGRFWDRIPETDGPWVWSYQEILRVSLFCVPRELSSIKASKNKQEAQSESKPLENSLRLVGGELLSVPGSARHFGQTSDRSHKTQFANGEISQPCDQTVTRNRVGGGTNSRDIPGRRRSPELQDRPFSASAARFLYWGFETRVFMLCSTRPWKSMSISRRVL